MYILIGNSPKIQTLKRVGKIILLAMKTKINLLLLIFLFVFSQNVFSQSASSQLKMRKAKNCNALFNTNNSFTWNGAIKNGYCHGYGTIKWYDNKGVYQGKMVGTIKRGKSEGFCTFYGTNGKKIFEGMFENDMKNGKGKVFYNDGTTQEGLWYNDEYIGEEGDYAVVDTIAAESSEYYSNVLTDEDIKNLQEHLEVFCYNNYEDCFSGRTYIEYSLKVTKAEINSDGKFIVEGTHAYKGSYGTNYYDMAFNATLDFDNNKLVFNKRAKADFLHSSDYWEECTKSFLKRD